MDEHFPSKEKSDSDEAEERFKNILRDQKNFVKLIQSRVRKNEMKFGDTALARDLVREILLGNDLGMRALTVEENTENSFVDRTKGQLKKVDWNASMIRKVPGNILQLSRGGNEYPREVKVYATIDSAGLISPDKNEKSGKDQLRVIPKFSHLPRKYRNHLRHLFPEAFYFLKTVDKIPDERTLKELVIQAQDLARLWHCNVIGH